MLYERDLDEAIAECMGERNPNANTCIKLAAFYTIKHELFGKQRDEAPMIPTYSLAPAPAQSTETLIEYDSGTEFADEIHGRDASEIWPIIDELMSTLQAVLPRLYDGVMRKLSK